MINPCCETCGGCNYRNLDVASYRKLKTENFNKTLEKIKKSDFKVNPPIFISDGTRRRATFAFEYRQKKLIFGFNQKADNKLVNLTECYSLTEKINKNINFIRELMTAICSQPYNEKQGKKIIQKTISKGDVFVCEADNGLDVVLEFSAPLTLDYRMIVSEMINENSDIIRISHRHSQFSSSETIVVKTTPFIKSGEYKILIPAGTFLQPSAEGQKTLENLVKKYVKNSACHIADLFCGVGTFSYLFANQRNTKITAIDSSASLLKGFNDSLNVNQITNIKIVNKNLFKYPLDENELKEFDVVIFDPPRAGAKELCRAIAKSENQPESIIAISCNPQTFVNDAETLISGGYKLEEVTMIDQFPYSNHSELVAFFTKNKN